MATQITIYEAIIFDIRDKDSEYPSSMLGTFDTQEDASIAIWEHLDRFPEQRAFIVKTEVVAIPTNRLPL